MLKNYEDKIKTQLVAGITFNNHLLSKDLKILEELPIIKEQYDEFSSGTWINHSLWNSTGKWKDTEFVDIDGKCLETELINDMPYLKNFIENTFDLEHMTMARIRNLKKGIVIPHIDFLELSDDKYGYVRILMPLETCIDSYHTEEKFGVFRMRKGEVWILESQLPHSAHNLGNDNRRLLSIDFRFTDEEFPHYSRIFKDKSVINENITPSFVKRSELEKDDLSDYLQILASEWNDKCGVEEILSKLSLLQLRFESKVSDIYKNLISVAEKTGKSELVSYAQNVRKFYIESRVMGERFPIRKNIL